MMKHFEEFEQEAVRIALTSGLSRERVAKDLRIGKSRLEVTQTGFHKLIADHAEGRTYEQILALFGGQLGAEGRALARALSLILPDQLSPLGGDE